MNFPMFAVAFNLENFNEVLTKQVFYFPGEDWRPQIFSIYSAVRDRVDIDPISMCQDIAENVYNERIRALGPTNDRRNCYEVILMMCVYYLRPSLRGQYSTEDLLAVYTRFKDHDEVTNHVLLRFRNMMVLALRLIAPQRNKGKLLKLVTSITEGHQAKYITGTGQSYATRCRVDIYHHEGNIKVSRRVRNSDYRAVLLDDSEESKKRKRCYEIEIAKKENDSPVGENYIHDENSFQGTDGSSPTGLGHAYQDKFPNVVGIALLKQDFTHG